MSAEQTNLIQNRYAVTETLFERLKKLQNVTLKISVFWLLRLVLNAEFGGMKRIHLGKNKSERCVINMLWTIAIVLVGLWLLGVVTSYTLGGFIHILLVLAIITVLIRVIRGKRVMGR